MSEDYRHWKHPNSKTFSKLHDYFSREQAWVWKGGWSECAVTSPQTPQPAGTINNSRLEHSVSISLSAVNYAFTRNDTCDFKFQADPKIKKLKATTVLVRRATPGILRSEVI